MTRILLVEDNQDIGSAIQEYLEACARQVTWVPTVKEAKKEVDLGFFDVAILDRMLPDGSGEDLCVRIKQEHPMPVLLETAKSQIEDKLEGFAAGADDYLTKPFDLRELEARIRVLEKGKSTDVSYVQLGPRSIDLAAMRLADSRGKEKHITAHEWIVLKLLLENPGEVVDRNTLIEYIRGSDGFRDAENKLDVLVSGLRRKIGKKLIVTVKGYGYKVVSEN